MLRETYSEYYADAPFVHITETPPSTKQTLGANTCLLYPTVDPMSGEVTVISCIDNLVKGAAGGAVQCFNLMFGIPETVGLSKIGVYP